MDRARLWRSPIFLAANNTTGWDGPDLAVADTAMYGAPLALLFLRGATLIAKGEKLVPLTDPECTRFYMKMSEAVDLVMKTYHNMKGGEIAIPKLPAYRLGDLADAMQVKFKVIGLPPWEKMHESMAEGNSSNQARRMTINELQGALDEC